MGAITNSIPTWIVEALQREFGIGVFVETGLGQGTSVLWADKHFHMCISVELDAEIICQFKARHPYRNIIIYSGDSGTTMASIVPAILSPALFWLDGHTDDYTPILIEIAAINASRLDHFIMVDDLRLFGQLAAWPTNGQLREMAQDNGRRALFEIDDVLVAIPAGMAVRVEKIIEAR